MKSIKQKRVVCQDFDLILRFPFFVIYHNVKDVEERLSKQVVCI